MTVRSDKSINIDFFKFKYTSKNSIDVRIWKTCKKNCVLLYNFGSYRFFMIIF